MLVAEAKVETERSSRYLVQLCRHVDAVARAQPQMQAHVEWSDDRGMISFDWGRCTLRAVLGVLTLHVEAAADALLELVQAFLVGGRLQQIGRRDHLTVTWTLPEGVDEETPEPPARRHSGHERSAHD
jgi:hypothetical protein